MKRPPIGIAEIAANRKISDEEARERVFERAAHFADREFPTEKAAILRFVRQVLRHPRSDWAFVLRTLTERELGAGSN